MVQITWLRHLTNMFRGHHPSVHRREPAPDFRERLVELRAQFEASGEHLLTREELRKEIAERRGGVYESED